MSIFDYTNYRLYLQEEVKARPRGLPQQISRATGIHPSVLSQVLQGKRDLTADQAAALAAFLGLDEEESQFFLLLNQIARAGTEKLRKLLDRQLQRILQERSLVARRLPKPRGLSAEGKALFYSNWFYSAVRVLSAIPGCQTREALRQRVGLDAERFRAVLSFLLEHRLCVEEKGKILPASQSTHIPADSPLVARHHGNWRVKAMERHPMVDPARELAFTSVMALSEKDALWVRARLLDAIEEVCRRSDPSPSEVAYFLGIDWLTL